MKERAHIAQRQDREQMALLATVERNAMSNEQPESNGPPAILKSKHLQRDQAAEEEVSRVVPGGRHDT